MKKYWKKLKAFWFELGNLLTNIACPFLSIAAALLEVANAPVSWIQGVKKAEYWCWNACGTKEKIDDIVEKLDDVVDAIDEIDFEPTEYEGD